MNNKPVCKHGVQAGILCLQCSPEEAGKCGKFDCPNHNGGYGTPCNEGYEVSATQSWEKDFDKEFSTVIQWIKMSCKEEIISGIDIKYLDKYLKSFIRKEKAASYAQAIQKAIKMVEYEMSFDGDKSAFSRGCRTAYANVLNRLSSLQAKTDQK